MKRADGELENVLSKYRKFIEVYGWSSYTLQAIKRLKPILDELPRANLNSLIDLGCGYKALTCIIADYLRISEVYGIDIDESRLKSPNPLPITVIQADITQPISIPGNKKFDIIICLGVIEHVLNWDALLNNINMLSKKGSYLLLSAPNLGSWINRVALLFGFQPRDLEISSRKLYHVLPCYRGHTPAGHVKITTYNAIKVLLEDNGFRIIKAVSLYTKDNIIANIIDSILSPWPSLARRYAILAQKAC